MDQQVGGYLNPLLAQVFLEGISRLAPEGAGEVVPAEPRERGHLIQGHILLIMVVDIGQHAGDHLLIFPGRPLMPADRHARQIPLAQDGVHPHDAAVAQGVPHQVPFVIDVHGFLQQRDNFLPAFRVSLQVENPLQPGGKALGVQHAQDKVRLEEEKIPAAALAHHQGVLLARRHDQHLVLPDIVAFSFHRVGDRSLQGPQHLHGGVVVVFIPPGNVRIPDPEGGVLRIGHIFPLLLQQPESVLQGAMGIQFPNNPVHRIASLL